MLSNKFICQFKLALVAFAMSLIALSTPVQANCGKVSVADMNWASAQFVSALSQFILEKGYGCEVETIQTSTVPGITSLVEKGTPNFAPETWENSIKTVLTKGIGSGNVIELGDMFSKGGREMWLIPQYTAEKHNIKTIEDLKANAGLFKDPENPSKGRFYNCPAGWACQIVNNNLFKAYGMDKNFTNFNPGSGEGLTSSLAKAYARKQAWFGYYWGPTAILGKYAMQEIQMNPADLVNGGHTCNITAECANPHAGKYPKSVVVKVATKELLQRDPSVSVFLARYEVPNAILNRVLAWGEDNQAKADEVAGYFMAKYPTVWQGWLSSSALKKVKSAL